MLTDKESRNLIVNDINSNYFVEASAGSGKTYSLVLRMIAMIEDGNNPNPVTVDQICTITFTKAAAAEFFSRFQQALSLRSVPTHYSIDDSLPPKTEITMERCKKALENIDLCFLGTIDAFCNMIAHELPTELNILSDAEVISNKDKLRLLEDLYEKILKDDTNPHHEQALLVEDSFYKARDLFPKVMTYLGDLRNTDIIYDKELAKTDINTYISKEEKDEFLTYVKALCSKDISYNPKRDGLRSDKYKNQIALKTLCSKINTDDWSHILSDISFAIKQIKDMEGFSKDVLGTGLDKYNLFEIPEKVKANASIKYSEEAKKCFENIKNKIDNYCFALALDFCITIIHDVFDGLKNQGKLGFFDYLYYLNEALKNDFFNKKTIINHILKRHSRFLLDESQDTNPLQTEMFFYLTGTNTEAKDWTEAKPRPGSLFIVGDPKQSIYGFRNANVQAFNKVKSIFEKENKVLILTQNYRSKEILKEWFNEAMNNILDRGVEPTKHLDIPIDEEKKKLQEELNIYQGVYKYQVNSDDDPEAVARFIVEMVNNPQKVIQVKNKSTDKLEVRQITFGDIRVVPRGTNIDKYVAAFNKYHIPVILEASIPFKRSETLLMTVDVVNLLKSPNDKTLLFKVLYGDLFALDDIDILKMKADGFEFDISKAPIVFTNEKHQEIIDLLHLLWEESQGFRFSSSLLYILNNEKLNIFSKTGTDFLEYTFYLIEKVKEKEEIGQMSSVEKFTQYVADFIDGETDDNRTVRFKNDSDRVILANLHKVKGLQAPIVILCGPRKGGNKSLQRVDYSKETPTTNIGGIKDDFFAVVIEKHDVLEDRQNEWDAYEKAEKERIEYVGATRAESVLIVADKKASSKTSDSKYPDFNPWEDLIANIPDSQFITVPDVAPQDITPIDVSLDKPLDCSILFKQSVVFISPSKKANDFKDPSFNDNLDEIREVVNRDSATQIGTLIHRLMECLVSSRGGYLDLTSLVNQIIEEYRYYDYKDLLMDVATKMTSGGYLQKKSSINQDLLSLLLKAKEVYCEVPFSYQKDGDVVMGVIDLIYKDEDGYHIIDYKTNKNDNVSYLENVEYKEQLNDYVTALKEMGIEADAHIYHIAYR